MHTQQSMLVPNFEHENLRRLLHLLLKAAITSYVVSVRVLLHDVVELLKEGWREKCDPIVLFTTA